MDAEVLDRARLTPLHYAAFRNSVGALKVLLSSGRVNPDCADPQGLVPICGAANSGNVEVVRALLKAGAKEGLGHALACASVSGETEVVRVLLEAKGAGAEGVKSRMGYSLRMAAQRGFVDIVRLLMGEGGVDVGYCQPLIAAAVAGKGEVVRVLLGFEEVGWGNQVRIALEKLGQGGEEEVKELLRGYKGK